MTLGEAGNTEKEQLFLGRDEQDLEAQKVQRLSENPAVIHTSVLWKVWL